MTRTEWEDFESAAGAESIIPICFQVRHSNLIALAWKSSRRRALIGRPAGNLEPERCTSGRVVGGQQRSLRWQRRATSGCVMTLSTALC